MAELEFLKTLISAAGIPKKLVDVYHKAVKEGEKQTYHGMEIWPLRMIPPKFSRREEPRGSIFSPPRQLDITGVGQIKQVPKVAKALRKILQAEMKARGRFPKRKVSSKILRGTFYHGRRTYPKVEEFPKEPARFIDPRMGSGNIGEPSGLSITYNPTVAVKFGKTKPKWYHDTFKQICELSSEISSIQVKLKEYASVLSDAEKTALLNKKAALIGKKKRLFDKVNTEGSIEFARVAPLFGASPEKVILRAWEPEAGKEIKRAYTRAVKRMIKEYPPLGRKTPKNWKEFEDYLLGNYGTFTDSSEGVRTFNNLVRDELKARGWKGILYSPHRYKEYELRMFDPKDVLMLERRTMKESGIKRMWRAGPREGRSYDVAAEFLRKTEFAPVSLRDWYSQINMEKLLNVFR